MEATLDIQNIAYCTLDIEGSRIPPTMNFIDSIYIQDGFGVSIPVMQLWLNDQKGSLSEDLNLQDGTLVSIRIAKTRELAKVRKFRMFGFRKQQTASGPRMVVTCILDVPKWASGVYTESVRGTSSSILNQLAQRAGLKYSGANSVDDAMTWLNVNKTRSAFSEDVAIRGYGNNQTCMYRMLNMDYELRYRDLFDVLKQEPKWSLLMNTGNDSAKGTPIIIRETQNASASGFATHFLNYGHKQYEHSLNDAGQLSNLTLDAPLLGSALPINEDVRSQVADRGARVSYTGFDTGTEPLPASNLHRNYEKAFYQNMRYLGLFSERIIALSDEFTEAVSLDCVEYHHADQDNHEFKPSKGLGGKWLLGGKTVWIKAGHKYSELFYLYRPALMETGATNAAGKSGSSSAQNSKANAGPINLVEEAGAETTVTAPTATPIAAATKVKAVPAASAATNTLSSLKEFGASTPLVPAAVNTGPVTSAVMQSQDTLRTSVTQFSQSQGPLRETLVAGGEGGVLEGFKTIKKYGSDVITLVANGQTDPRYVAQEIDRMRNDSTYAKNTAIARVTSAGEDLTGMRLHNIVSASTGGELYPEAVIGDVLSGGLWADDLREAGISPDSIAVPIPIPLSVLENPAVQMGSSFLHEATGLGFTEDNILINPHATARNIERWANETSPEKLLVEQGARAYIDTFGHISPTEAKVSMETLGSLAADVALLYSKDELVVDSALTSEDYVDVGKEILFQFGDPTIVPVVDKVERVVQYGEYSDVTSRKSLVTWAEYYSMGAELGDAVSQWKFPFTFPSKPIVTSDDTNGNPTQFDESTQKWIQNK